ncbi:PqiC family protein [Methylophaga sp.]|uniref:PqiC family protein n=1 Tax=Methylophaga sp. TaxID=2024840 RepID=UPI003A8F6B3D
MFITFNKSFVGFLLVFSLVACATKPVNTQRYTLPDNTQTTSQVSADAEQVLVIGSIGLTEFLDSDRIVQQLDDITLHQARDNLWAENLAQQIRRGLRSRLSSKLPNILVVSDSRGLKQDAWNLQLDIEQFQGHFNGNALTSGQWQLQDSQGNLIAIKSFNIETTLITDGYPALVRALGNNLDKLAEQLASQIHSAK